MAVFVPLRRCRSGSGGPGCSSCSAATRTGSPCWTGWPAGTSSRPRRREQDRVLASAEVEPFLDTLFTHAIEGMYSVPEYGGNAALRGWQDIGWPGDRQPVGYPPAQVSQPAQADVLHPTGVVAKLLRLLDPSWTDAGGG